MLNTLRNPVRKKFLEFGLNLHFQIYWPENPFSPNSYPVLFETVSSGVKGPGSNPSSIA